MADQTTTGAMHQIPEPDNSMVLRVPKPSIQIAVLGLVAIITLFQTVQLLRISARASSAPVKSAPAAVTNPNVPQSMVGGC